MHLIRLVTSLGIFRNAARKHALPGACLLSLLLLGFAVIPTAPAQTGGEAGIQGTVTDPEGAAIPGASVAVKNNATGVVLTRQTDGSGLYSVSPILPGQYTVTVAAQGFEKYVQNNLQADALVMTPLNVQMKIGAADTTVEVTAAPPALETTNATLGLTIENTTYANLPLQLNGAQRDPTAFGALAPGAQAGARLPIIGGTGNYLGQLYLDGLPSETVSQQGDNRLVSLAIDVDSVDQMQVVTSTPPAEYSGAGAENFTMKSGSLQWHGSVKDFIRNTSLDAWQFVKPATKPIDHQNEFSATIGGHVPGTKRVFFFFAYDRYHNRSQNTATNWTVPTTQMRSGDFRQLACLQISNASDQATCVAAGGPTGTSGSATYGSTTIPVRPIIYDPTSNNCPTGGTCTRSPFIGSVNGTSSYNVIPSSYISPIAQAMQQWLPAPTNTNIVNNYVAGYPTGFDNHVYNYRVDFQINEKHRISTVGAMGTENYLNNVGSGPYLPLPYTGGDLANIYPKDFDVQDAYTISNSMVNQLKFGFVRFYQNIHSWTENSATYGAPKLGITNLPTGQGGTSFPGAQFGTSTLQTTMTTNWTGTNTGVTTATATQLTTPNNFALVDNLQWIKGAHNLTFGFTIQWQQINNANPATFTPNLNLYYDALSTSNYVNGQLSTGSSTGNTTGYAYASYLLGAVVGSSSTSPPSLALQYVSEEGGRYRPIAPYVEDTWKVNSKLTIDAGLRWDYLPPYREVKNHWSFLNPNLTNPATGTLGALQFAGNYGGSPASCGCTTPVNTYWKNWGPRVGITYQSDPNTVWRIGAGRVFSQGGGVGGRGGAFNGTGQVGFNTTATGPTEVLTGSGAGPSFYLNNSAYFQSRGIANTDLFGAGYQYAAPPAPGTGTLGQNAGHYIGSNGKPVNASTISGYADPYFSGRAPDVMFYNAGIEHAFTPNLTFAVNYVGNESHHLINSTSTGTGNPRGYWSGELDPKYLVGLGGATDSTGKLPLLTAPANNLNVAKAQSIMSGLNIPGFFQAAAQAGDTTATIAQGLVAFPQYSGTTDTWGANVGNFSYNSLQVTVQQRLAHGLTFNFNYTWARNVGDDGPFRTGYNLPSGSVSGTTRSYHMNRIDRSETTVSTPNVAHAFAVWDLPFGRNHIGGGNAWVRAIAGGWQLNGTYTYASGTPALITYSGCTTPLQGQCMPDVATTYTGPARINGGFGASSSGGRLASNLGHVQYFNVTSFQTPQLVSPTGVAALNLIGNAPRTGAYNLRNPPQWQINTGVRRTFPIWERLAFTFEADAFNTLNHVIFGSPNGTWGPGSASFGTITGTASNYAPRQFEVAGHLTF